MQRCVLVFGFLLFSAAANGTSHDGPFRYELKVRDERQVSIDGILDPQEWSDVSPMSRFINKWPIDSGFATAQTEVKITYDQNFLYVAAKNYQRRQDLVIQSLKRDNEEGHWGSDGFTLVVDPMNKQNNGFMFGVNAGGAQLEGTLTLEGTQTEGDPNWDNRWYSSTQIYDDYWVTEMAIPFNTLRFDPSNRTWGINFIRNDMKNNVYSTWARVPLGFRGIDLGHMGEIHWDAELEPNNGNVILVPYVAGSVNRDFEEGEGGLDGDIGLDAKIALTSSLNLDLTVNPDFSNVDVDQQQTNLTQFSLLFPERRGFFLENSDLFSNYGAWGIIPFFSRRIGLSDGQPVPILYGARLSGNLTKSLRIGVMDVQTRATEDQRASNYFVTSFQQQVLSRSRVKVLLANRQGLRGGPENDSDSDYNRAGGVEFDYVSKSGYLTATAKYHAATDEQHLDNNGYYTLGARYSDSKFFGAFFFNHVGTNYIPDMGFVPQLEHYDPVEDTTIRVGFNRINAWIGHSHRPKKGPINVVEINPWSVQTYDLEGRLLSGRYGFWTQTRFKNRQELTIDLLKNDIRLRVPAEFVNDATPLPLGLYRNSFFRLEWNSDPRKALSGGVSVGRGAFYTGTRTEIATTLNFRQQPWGNFGFRYTQNHVELGGIYGETTLHLLGPTMEVNFSNSMFWTTFVQYNTQSAHLNINSRFQWRYLPMSDLFIVYSDNYGTEDFQVQNRGVVCKLTYWLNL